MTRQTNVVQSGTVLSLPSLLAVLFIGLKLTGHITWSWLWVLAPLWIPFIVVFIALGITVIVVAARDNRKKKNPYYQAFKGY